MPLQLNPPPWRLTTAPPPSTPRTGVSPPPWRTTPPVEEELKKPEPGPPVVAYDALAQLAERWGLGSPAEAIAGIGRLLARYNPNQAIARAVGIPGAEEVVKVVDKATEPLAAYGEKTLSDADEALQTAGVPAPVRTGTLLATELVGPEELAPGGAIYKGLKGVKPVAKAAAETVAKEVVEAAPEAISREVGAALTSDTVGDLGLALDDLQRRMAAGAISEEEASVKLLQLGRMEARLTDPHLTELAEKSLAIGGDEAAALREMGVEYTPPPPAKRAAERVLELQPAPRLSPEAGVLQVAPAPRGGARATFAAPDVEAAFQRGRAGRSTPSVLNRLSSSLRTAGAMMTREVASIPHGGRWSEVREALRRIRVEPSIASEEIARDTGAVFRKLSPEDKELFDRKLLLDTAAATLERNPKAVLPNKLNGEVLAVEKPKVDALVEANLRVRATIEDLRTGFRADRDRRRVAGKPWGLDDDWLDSYGEDYFHHEYLDVAERLQDAASTGGVLKLPPRRGFSRTRTAAKEGDLNLKYSEVMGQTRLQLRLDARKLEELARIKRIYADPVESQMKAEAKRLSEESGSTVRWNDLDPPEGYEWVDLQRVAPVFHGYSLPEQVAMRILERGVGEVAGKDVGKALMVGQRRRLVLPTEISRSFEPTARGGDVLSKGIFRANERAVQGWKSWVTTVNPRRYVKFVFRNFVGDAQKTLQGNPRAFTRAPESAKEIFNYLTGQEPGPELRSWLDRGGLGSGLSQTELALDEKRLARIVQDSDRVREALGAVLTSPKKAWSIWRRLGDSGREIAEGTLRYANYREFLDKANAGKGTNYAASIPEEIEGLADAADQAYWLSNELIGAYDMVSVFGQFARREGIPFYSFLETNPRTNFRLLKNALRSPAVQGRGVQEVAKMVGRGILAKSPGAVVRAGKFLGLAYAFELAMDGWNRTAFPDEEKDLPADVRKRAHIIFGRKPTGEVIYFDRLSGFEEAREWFGLDQFGNGVLDYLDGRATPQEVAGNIANEVTSRAVQSVGPVSLFGGKLWAELLLGRSFFPDLRNPREIMDPHDYLAQQLGLQHEFRALTGRPDKEYMKTWLEAVAYEIQPGQSAYYDTRARALDWKSKTGGGGGGGGRLSPRTEALRNYKASLRYGRADIAAKYLEKYYSLGGTDAGMSRSLSSLHPLSEIALEDREDFVDSLRPEEQQDVERAINYYEDLLGSS